MEPFINEDHGRPRDPKGAPGRCGLKDLNKGRVMQDTTYVHGCLWWSWPKTLTEMK